MKKIKIKQIAKKINNLKYVAIKFYTFKPIVFIKLSINYLIFKLKYL